MDLSNKAVIVTGSSSGIGEAVARRLAGLGAGVVVNSARSVEAGERIAACAACRRPAGPPSLPMLRRADDAWIVNVTSIAGIRQTGSSLPYAVSKAALDHLTAIMAKHAGGNVRVNAVAPGLVATPWTADWSALHEGVAALAPLHRVASADDIADAVLAVATTYAPGQTLLVDGGLGLTM